MLQLNGGPPPVQAKRIPKLPVEYPQTKSHGPDLVNVPVTTVVGHPTLQDVFGGIRVDGPAEKLIVLGRARLPQHGWYILPPAGAGANVLQSMVSVVMLPHR